jgi:hypothetical protein
VRNTQNTIKHLWNNNGRKVEVDEIKQVAESFYKNLLGVKKLQNLDKERVLQLLKSRVPEAQQILMLREVTADEIKKTIFAMNNSNSPGPDGFCAGFFQKAWSMAGNDVVDVIQSFFSSGKLLKEVNATIISLVPNKINPSSLSDYRPISCCNVVCKCITKILANWLMPSNINAKLKMVMRNRDWFWPATTSDVLVHIQSKLEFVERSEEDTARWVISKSGVYSSADTWAAIRTKHNVVDWWHLVWFPLSIPRHRFILWLAIKNHLSTGDRLVAWGYNGVSSCSFCRSCIETRDHMFFQCSFSKSCEKMYGG